MVVDLQPDQVSVSYPYTTRAPRGSQTTTHSVNTLYLPEIQDARLYWSVSTVTVDDQAVSDDLIRPINASIESSWRNYLRRKSGHISNFIITDTDITIPLE